MIRNNISFNASPLLIVLGANNNDDMLIFHVLICGFNVTLHLLTQKAKENGKLQLIQIHFFVASNRKWTLLL